MKYRQLLRGIATYLPGAGRRRPGTGGTDSARYCYSVWLRHLVMAQANGLDPFPRVVAELGPGDSLGIGYSALISGCDRYYALDIVPYANVERNLSIFDQLVELFRERAPIPGNDEFPNVKPHLDHYGFPEAVLDENRLRFALDSARIAGIRDALRDPRRRDAPAQYRVPWLDAKVLESGVLDMVFSQAALEHVDDLPQAYHAMRLWLKPGGAMSHQIDFKCHRTATEWNGHWAYSDLAWRLIKGRRPYLLNREPHSTHVALLREEGFALVCDRRIETISTLTRDDLAPRFRSIADEDLVTSGAFIQAVRAG